jgi:hypothetical protein
VLAGPRAEKHHLQLELAPGRNGEQERATSAVAGGIWVVLVGKRPPVV